MSKPLFRLPDFWMTFRGSKPSSLSQGTAPLSPNEFNASFSGDDRGGRSQDLTLTLPHSNTQDLKKKMIVVQKYEPNVGEKGLAVSRGATVLLIREEGEWMYVRNENGGEGFVPRSHLVSPSATRTRTSSRSGSGSRQVMVDRGKQNGNVASGSVPMHYTKSADRPQRLDTAHTRPHVHHVDDYPHHITNGHAPTLTTNAAVFDQKYSPSSSSGVASLLDPISPGSNLSPTQDGDRAPSSNSSLDHSHGSYSSCEQCVDSDSRPTLISPLNHMDKGVESLGKRGAVESNETLSHAASGRTTSESNISSAVVRPSQTVVDRNNHFVDDTTNHVYGMLEDNRSPPPVPPRRIPGYSASQDPDAVYSQLDHRMVRAHKTCSQEAIVHPSHRGTSYTEGWTKEKRVPQPPQDAATPTENDYQKLQKNPRQANYKEVVELRRNSKKNGTNSPQGDKKKDRVVSTGKAGEEQRQTSIAKFRKTFWGVFVVTTDFEPLDENEVGVQKGEHVSVWNQDDRDWFWVVRHNSSSSEEGFVPSVCLREVSSEPKHASAVESVESLRHNSYSSTPSSSPRPEDISVDRMRQRSSSHESRRSTSAAQHHRPSSGSSSSSGRRTRKTSDGSAHSQRLRNRVPSNLSIQKGEHAPTPPPSSPPPPYSEIDNNSQFVSLSQQPPDTQTPGQHPGVNHAMHRTRSQGYVTSRSTRFQRHPSPSTPQNELGGGGGNSQLSNNEGTLV